MRKAPQAQSIKQYLFLIRLPNIFTIPSNIFAGYFSSAQPFEIINLAQLSMLTASSALLYVYGMALNDYFDVAVDRLERPHRPLPSGQIPRRNALVMAIVAVLLANVIASLVSVTSLAISVALSAVIFAYDYRTKNGKFGPLFMGAARFLNVILGASWAWLCFLGCSLDANTLAHTFTLSVIPWRALFAAGAMFAYIYSITLLSKKEAGEQKSQVLERTVWQSFSIILAIVAATVFLAFYLDSIEMSVNITIFAVAVFYAKKQVASLRPQNIQHAVRDLLLSVIILDSIFITAFAGLHYYYYGMLVLLLIIPPIFLAKRMYAT